MNLVRNTINYAHTIINLESYIETELKSGIFKTESIEAYSFENERYTIKFDQNAKLKNAYENNLTKNFPENIFIGFIFNITIKSN